MIKNIFEASMFVLLLLMGLACVFLVFNPVAFGQNSGVPGVSTGTGYPVGSAPVYVGLTGANTASISGTFSAVAGRFNYICGFDIEGLGATAATIVTPSLSLGATTFAYNGAFTFAAGAAVADVPFSKTFSPCLPATAANTAISVTTPGAAGNTSFAVNMWGYTLPAN